MGKMDSLKKRPTIALLFRSFWHTNINRWEGSLKAAEDLDVNLITFIGGLLKSPGSYESRGSILYGLVDREQIDAVIIWPLTIGMNLTTSEIMDFLKRYQSFPLVCGEGSYPGIPSILQSDHQGIRDLMLHFIETHQITRIAFLRGPAYNSAAEERYRAYQEVLAEFGLPLDPNLVTTPVAWSQGYNAMKELLDDRNLKPGIDFEAVIAANSSLMLNAARLLNERGVKIPNDVAIAGFDDSDQFRAMNPPLTVACSDFQELGYKAVETVMELLNGKEIPERTYIPTRLIIRQSCGCNSISDGENYPEVFGGKGANSLSSMDALKERIVAELIQSGFESSKAIHSVETLLKDWENDLKRGSNNFTNNLRGLLGEIRLDTGEVLIRWQNILSALRNISLAVQRGDSGVCGRVEEVIHRARITVNVVGEGLLFNKALRAKRDYKIIQEIAAALITSFNMEGIKNVMFRELPRLGIPACYLALYENPEESLEWSRLVWAFNRQGIGDIPKDGVRFRSASLLPKEFFPNDRRFSLVVEPLFFENDQIGFVIFECGPWDGTYSVLKTMLSSAIWGANILQKQQRAEEDLKKKADELARSNKELEQFAYIVSHDLQEPLRKIVAFGDRLKKICSDKLSEQGLDYLERMQSAASRMQRLINDLLTYSRVTTKAQPFDEVDLLEVLEEVISDLEPRIVQCKARVKTEKLPVVKADATQMGQLFQNLIVNALKFHREGVPTEVEVYPVSTPKGVEIVVADNGIGIAEEYRERIFGVFERLHGRNEYDGSGIGLAICKKITDRHGWKIRIESRVGEGSKFIIEIPMKSISR